MYKLQRVTTVLTLALAMAVSTWGGSIDCPPAMTTPPGTPTASMTQEGGPAAEPLIEEQTGTEAEVISALSSMLQAILAIF
jgi:hypothetical protein